MIIFNILYLFRRNRQKYKSYLQQRAMSSLNGYESSKLQFHDTPYDDDLDGPSTFTLPRPKVTNTQYEMQETRSDLELLEGDGAAKVIFIQCIAKIDSWSSMPNFH